MKSFRSKVYRYPNKEWVILCFQSLAGFFLGSAILFMPLGVFRWAALLPLGYGLFKWHRMVRPKRAYVIRTNDQQLMVGAKTYDWDQIDHMELDRSEGKKRMRLTGLKGRIDTGFDSDLPGFSELTQECLFHMNQPVEEEKEPESEKMETTPKQR